MPRPKPSPVKAERKRMDRLANNRVHAKVNRDRKKNLMALLKTTLESVRDMSAPGPLGETAMQKDERFERIRRECARVVAECEKKPGKVEIAKTDPPTPTPPPPAHPLFTDEADAALDEDFVAMLNHCEELKRAALDSTFVPGSLDWNALLSLSFFTRIFRSKTK